MKRLTFLLCLATFAAVTSSRAQMEADSNSISGIKRPVPSASATPAAKASGSAKPFEASLTSDEKAKSSAASASTFPASTSKIYVHFEDDGAAKGDKIRVVWTAEDAKPYPKNKKITENSGVLPGPGSLGSYYLPADGLPVGKYSVAVSVNDKPVKSFKFAVTK